MTDPTTKAIESIKSFHGTAQDNSRDWCDRAEIVFTAFNVNDNNRLARIGLKLENDAFNWYRDNQGPYATWLVFRQALQRAFPPPERTQNRHLLAEQINQRKQGPDESVHDYYYSLDKLCREYNPQMSSMDKAIKLVGGLREELKEKILPMNVQTPEEFMIQAKNFESSQKVMANHRKQNGPFELAEPTYNFESNGYSIISTTQPHQQQHHPHNLQQQHFRQNHPQNFQQQHHPHNLQQQHFRQNHPQNFQQQHHQQIYQQYHPQNHHQEHHQLHYHQNHQQPQHTRTRDQPIEQNKGQSIRNKQTNINYPKSDHRKCFQCGQIGHLQRSCSYHLKE